MKCSLKTMTRTRNILGALSLLLVANSFAQREFRAVFFAKPDGAPDKMYAHFLGEKREIELLPNGFCDPIKLPKGAYPIRFSEKETLPEEYPADQTVNIRLNEDTQRFLLFVYPNPAQANLPVAIQKVDTGRNLRDGEMLWINSTNFTIGGTLGQQQLLIKPGETKKVGKPGARDERTYKVRLDCKRGNNPQKSFISSYWPNLTNGRMIAFARMPEGASVPIIEMIRDIDVEEE